MMTEQQFEELWQRAEAMPHAGRLTKELAAWKRRRQRTALTLGAALALAAAAVLWTKPAVPEGFEGVYCNRTGMADIHWANVAANILTTETL